MLVLAIDPGPEQSGWCTFDGARLHACGIAKNAELLAAVRVNLHSADDLAVEMIASYGMAVGREVFETVLWIGRFQQAWRDPEGVRLVYRHEVKIHLCGSLRAKDANIRQALIDRFGAVGTKRKRGPMYGVRSHTWSALAVAVVALEA